MDHTRIHPPTLTQIDTDTQTDTRTHEPHVIDVSHMHTQTTSTTSIYSYVHRRYLQGTQISQIHTATFLGRSMQQFQNAEVRRKPQRSITIPGRVVMTSCGNLSELREREDNSWCPQSG